jgi:hypothetical protein
MVMRSEKALGAVRVGRISKTIYRVASVYGMAGSILFSTFTARVAHR